MQCGTVIHHRTNAHRHLNAHLNARNIDQYYIVYCIVSFLIFGILFCTISNNINNINNRMIINHSQPMTILVYICLDILFQIGCIFRLNQANSTIKAVIKR